MPCERETTDLPRSLRTRTALAGAESTLRAPSVASVELHADGACAVQRRDRPKPGPGQWHGYVPSTYSTAGHAGKPLTGRGTRPRARLQMAAKRVAV